MQEVQSSTQATTGTANYSWAGVIEFLQEQVRQNTLKQSEWLLEKQHLLTELGRAEGEAKAMEVINNDLTKRVKMLEFCLRQERIKYSALLTNKNMSAPELKGLLDNQFQIHGNASSQLKNLPLPKRRAKGHRNLVMKFLEEVGYEDIFNSEQIVEREQHNKTGIHPSQRNSTMTEPKHTDEADRTENISVLDHSSFKKGFDKSPEQRYSSMEEKDVQSDHSPYRGDDRSFRIKGGAPPQELKSGYGSDTNKSMSKTEWRQKCTLSGHFDGVRDLFVHGADSILCSVSEDCVVKIWDLNKLRKGKDSATIDSYLTLREHSGLLFAVSGPPKEIVDTKGKRLLYTAGSEGVIRVWDIPASTECEMFGQNVQSYCLAGWEAHSDTIWEINHHPFRHQIMSVSSDGYIKIWETLNPSREVYSSGKVKNQFFSRSSSTDENGYLVPTSATWIQSHLNHIVAGYVNYNALLIFDEENKTKPIGTLEFNPSIQGPRLAQPNKVLSHPHMPLLISAHEDRCLRFFDLNSNKMIRSIPAHNDAVTSICYQTSTTNLISASHDGSVKIWDLRKYGLVQEITGVHLRKYDEQIHCVTTDESSQLIMTGGADGLVSIIERA